jgi:3-deoxy-D-manno-octulosonic-acid transferase
MPSPTGASDPPAAALALAAYRGLGHAFRPFVPLALARRARRGKEDPARTGERYGIASIPRPAGRVVWVHAASVGETNAVMGLVERILAAGLAVVLTTETVTSAALAVRRLPAGAVHQFSPLDVAPFVARFLDHWRPDLALFVESEIWPVTILQLAARGVPQVRLNAHMSARSARGWARVAVVARALFGRFTLCLAQSEADGARYRALGAAKVTVIGNLKFDEPPPAADPGGLAAFRTEVGARPLWVAASTHEGEEAAVAGVHRRLAERHRDLLTVIVPRHPARGAEIRAALTADGLAVAQRSRGERATPATGIYLADTLGEMGLFYRAAPIAFVGGTLAPIGGHNPIEPVQLDAAVIHGPHTQNAAGIYAALDAGGGAIAVADAAELAAAVARLLDDPLTLAAQRARAVATLVPFMGALERTFAALTPWLAAKDAAAVGA